MRLSEAAGSWNGGDILGLRPVDLWRGRHRGYEVPDNLFAFYQLADNVHCDLEPTCNLQSPGEWVDEIRKTTSVGGQAPAIGILAGFLNPQMMECLWGKLEEGVIKMLLQKSYGVSKGRWDEFLGAEVLFPGRRGSMIRLGKVSEIVDAPIQGTLLL